MSFRVPLFFASLACLMACGCGAPSHTGEEVPPPTEAQKRLLIIGDAYVRATAKNGKPPQNLNDLLPFLKARGKPDELLRSPDDNQNFEIVYGSNLIGLKVTGSDVPIVAYERAGKGGQRNVLRGDRETLLMSESELRSAKYPDGYKPPF
jgi:hypothetical protein